jgi:hypothetical protein
MGENPTINLKMKMKNTGGVIRKNSNRKIN